MIGIEIAVPAAGLAVGVGSTAGRLTFDLPLA
jgi:hypothetical protein